MKDIIVAALIAGAILCAVSMHEATARFDVMPTPKGTVVIDHLQGHAYQEPALPMFAEPR